MSTRSTAIAWLAKTYPTEIGNPIRVSKYYEEQNLWFLTFPASFLTDPLAGHLVILLQKAASTTSFHLLRVPFSFFRENKKKFDVRKEGNKFDLHISGRRSSWMNDLRSNELEFSQFCT